MIDLHLHTTASDGRLSADAVVDRAAANGVRVMAVTDHDTTASVPEVRALARARGIEAVSGIEITAIESGGDVHVLAYFLEPDNPALAGFLARQRATRIARVEAIGERLAALGLPIELAPLVAEAQRQTGRSIGRPLVARAMVAAGHVTDTREAFDRWLGRGLPAFVPRDGATPEEVIGIVHAAGGLASIAHPGKSIEDHRLVALSAAGLDAVEAFHPDHDAAMVTHYQQLAATLGLLLTGGSDFHGDPGHGLEPGSVTLPTAEWDRLREAGHRHARR